MTGRRLQAPLLALIAYVAGAMLLTAAVWGSPTTHWAGRCCDPEQSMWFLGWTPYALSHGLDPFFTTQIDAPAGVNLMWNTLTPLLGLMAWLPTAIGGPIFAYNVMLVVGIALSGWTAFLAFRRYADHDAGAFIGGAVYAFSPYIASHAQLHLNLTTAWVPALFLLVLDELLVRRRRPALLLGIALGLLSVVQLLIAEEILATSVIAAGVLVLVMAVFGRAQMGEAIRRLRTALATAAVTFLVVGAWPLAAQFLGPRRVVGAVQNTILFSTDLLNVVLPTPYQLIAPSAATAISRNFSGLYHEATGYLGLPLLILLVVIAVERWDDRRVRLALLVGLILLVLSLGAHLHVGGTDTGLPMPWLALGFLPLLEHAVPDRVTIFVWLAVGGTIAIVAGDWLRRGRGGAGRLLVLAAALAFILPVPLARSSIAIPAFFRTWSEQGIAPSDTVLIAPLPGNGSETAPMLWAAVAGHGVRMAEGFALIPLADGRTSAVGPATALTDAMQHVQAGHGGLVARGAVRAQIGADLRAANIRHVIVGPMAAQAEMVAFFSDLFGRPPETTGGVEIFRYVDVTGLGPEPPAAP